MRHIVFIPVVLAFFGFILTLLALVAGSSGGFMEDYALVTMNTSRIGYSIFNQTQSSSSNPFVQLLNNITNTIETDIETAANSIAKGLGLHDYYSAHILDYCEGYYIPSPLPNATLPLSKIKKLTTYCETTSKALGFTPSEVLQRDLNNSGLSGVTLETFGWPKELDYNFARMRQGNQALVGFYATAVTFCGLACVAAIVALFYQTKACMYTNAVISKLASLFTGIASSFVTTYARKAYDIINQQGNQIDIEAIHGGKIVTLTWVATLFIFLAGIFWSVELYKHYKKNKSAKRAYKDIDKTEVIVLPKYDKYNKYDGA